VLGECRIDDIAPSGVESSEGALLVNPHQARVADHVGAQNHGKPALDIGLAHGVFFYCSVKQPPEVPSRLTAMPRMGA
jgi:hypothetical protein